MAEQKKKGWMLDQVLGQAEDAASGEQKPTTPQPPKPPEKSVWEKFADWAFGSTEQQKKPAATTQQQTKKPSDRYVK